MSTTAPYAIAPDYAGKFKPSAAKEILSAVLNEKLQGKEFSADLTTQWTKEIADEVKTRLKGEPTEPAAARAACCLARHALQCALEPSVLHGVSLCINELITECELTAVCCWYACARVLTGWLAGWLAAWLCAARRRAQSRALQVCGAGRNRRAAGRGC